MKMKYSKLFVLILLISQTVITQGYSSTFFIPQKNAAADRAWLPFFNTLRAAVKRRDRTRLKEMMLPEFNYSLGHHKNPQQVDWREDAFKYWDNPSNPGWKELNLTLAKGAVREAAWWRKGNKNDSPPARVAPPAANIRWRIEKGLIPYIASFEYISGRWYFTSFDICCD